MKRMILFAAVCILSTSAQASFFKKKITVGPKDRPATLKLPRFYSDDEQYPLVLMLHGRGNDALTTDLYLGLSRNQGKLGYALLLANGTNRPSDGQRVWNATADCCADDEASVDDSTYLQNLVRDVIAEYSIDPEQVFLVGHSNGGFMSYRLACDTKGLFKGLVSVAGSTFADPNRCLTETPINVLQIHGTEDSIVPFDGAGKNYPAAEETVQRWANRNQCGSKRVRPLARNLLLLKAEPALDENARPTIVGNLFDLSLKPETDEVVYAGCAGDTQVGLWQVNGADHAPVFIGRNVIRQALEFVGYQQN